MKVSSHVSLSLIICIVISLLPLTDLPCPHYSRRHWLELDPVHPKPRRSESQSRVLVHIRITLRMLKCFISLTVTHEYVPVLIMIFDYDTIFGRDQAVSFFDNLSIRETSRIERTILNFFQSFIRSFFWKEEQTNMFSKSTMSSEEINNFIWFILTMNMSSYFDRILKKIIVHRTVFLYLWFYINEMITILLPSWNVCQSRSACSDEELLFLENE